MKNTLSWGALVGALLLAVVPVTSAAAATSITADTGGWVLAGQTAGFSVELAGATGEDLIVTIELAEGTVSVDDSGLALVLQPGSLSFTDVTTVTFTGPSADVTTALAERLTWTAPVDPDRSYLRLSISVGSYYAGLVSESSSGHHYWMPSGTLSWPAARDAAAALTYNGLTGYLVTITSSTENTFVSTYTGATTHYIAATSEISYVNPLLPDDEQYANEVDARYNYHWGAGPEAGDGIEFSSIPWFPGEPNGPATERCLLTNWFPTPEFGPGLWNDGACTTPDRYVVEFGGIGTETGPVMFDNLDAAAPADPEPELADTGAELMPALSVGSLALLVGFGMLTARRAWRAAPRPGA